MDGNLTVDGDLTVNGTQSVVSQANLAVDNSFVYLNSGDTIGSANTNFTGTGLDDAYFTGHYEGTTSQTFYVRIDGVGTGSGGVDTFEWSLDNFSTTQATGVDITGSDQALADGINIFFNATTGHTSGDKWDGAASPVNVDTGWFSNRNTGATGVGYTHLGIYFDVSDNKFKVTDEYLPEPTGTIDNTDSSYSLGVLVAQTFEGNLTGNVTGNLTGLASSASVLDSASRITLSGDVNGNVTFDGSQNVTITTTYNPNSIVNADINASAGIVDTKLATISTSGKVSNSATTATDSNIANAIVARDASGNFDAGIITADLIGDVTGQVSDISNHNTDSLSEGLSNLYYTRARFDSALGDSLSTQSIRNYFNASGDLSYQPTTGTFSIDVEQIYSKANFDSDLGDANTGQLPEGSNLYYTRGRFDSALGDSLSTQTIRNYFSAGGDLSYSPTTGTFSIDVEEIYTSADFDSDFRNRSVNTTTDSVGEGSTNLYYTSARADSDAKNAISVTDNGGDGSLSYTPATGVISYTGPSASEVRAHFSAGGDLTYDSATGRFEFDVESVYTKANFDSDLGDASTDDLPEGSVNLYYTTVRVDSDFDARLATKSTQVIYQKVLIFTIRQSEQTLTLM
jgi:hypothetical protein